MDLLRYFHYFTDDFSVVHYARKVLGTRSEREYWHEHRRMASGAPFEVGSRVFALRINNCEAAGLMVGCDYNQSVAVSFSEIKNHIESPVEVFHLLNKSGRVVVMAGKVDL